MSFTSSILDIFLIELSKSLKIEDGLSLTLICCFAAYLTVCSLEQWIERREERVQEITESKLLDAENTIFEELMATRWENQYSMVWERCQERGLELSQRECMKRNFWMEKFQVINDREWREIEERDEGYESAGEDDTIGDVKDGEDEIEDEEV
jgi:hypothetical protein